jgi:DNA-binding FadR family transcriptional regulator
MRRPQAIIGDLRAVPSGAATEIGRRIVAGEWPQHSALPPEAELARDLAVSRPSLREAIKLLTGKGLIRSTPGLGTVVRPLAEWNRLDPDVLVWEITEGPDESFVRDLFELRRMVEPEACAIAATRASAKARHAIEDTFQALRRAPDVTSSIAADLSFHRAIVMGTENQLLAAFLPAIEASLSLSFEISRAGGVTQAHVVSMHRKVNDAIIAGDADAARASMLTLLQRSERDALEALAPTRNLSRKESS